MPKHRKQRVKSRVRQMHSAVQHNKTPSMPSQPSHNTLARLRRKLLKPAERLEALLRVPLTSSTTP